MENKKYLKISELAKLVNLNKRTLHYYDEVGLFSPKIRDENGYRYYSFTQIIDLSYILSLRELDMSIEDIKVALSGDVNNSRTLLQDKITEIDEKIGNLERIKTVLTRKINFLEIGEHNLLEIRNIQLDDEHLILSNPIVNKDLPDVLEDVRELLEQEGKYLFSNDEQGIMTHSSKSIQQIEKEQHDYYYLKMDNEHTSNFIKPAGDYLSIIYKGGEKERKEAFNMLLDYSQKHQVDLEGYYYERELHGTVYDNQNQSIVEIQVGYKRRL